MPLIEQLILLRLLVAELREQRSGAYRALWHFKTVFDAHGITWTNGVTSCPPINSLIMAGLIEEMPDLPERVRLTAAGREMALQLAWHRRRTDALFTEQPEGE